jgi:hypothetical protein
MNRKYLVYKKQKGWFEELEPQVYVNTNLGE